MAYVDGFVAAVPTANKEQFLKHAKEMAVILKKHGASRVVECWGDDVPEGKVTSFPMAVKRQPDETVIFSWIEWPSKETRVKGMESFMADPAVKDMGPDSMPFDGMRIIFGGFEPILDA